MKFSLEKENKNSTNRIVKAFSSSLITLLQQYKLEQISISMLCNESTYPRSTFYNYFEDIYDLIDCILERLFQEISLNTYENINPNIRSLTLFENTYDVLSKYHLIIERITIKNNYNGSLMERIRSTTRSIISKIILKSECIAKFPISNTIMQNHYSNTIEMLIEKCFIDTNKITKEEALKSLDFLLGTLEREVKKWINK